MIRMLGKKKVATRIFWALAIIVIPSFVFFGIDAGQRSARHNLVARVNRQDITRRQFYDRLGSMIEQRRRFFGIEVEEGSPEMEALRDQALESLVREAILEQEARRRRLRVPDYEIEDQFLTNPAFLDEEGEFDRERFIYVMEFMPESRIIEIENEIRRSLTVQLLRHTIVRRAGLEVTDDFVEEYREEYELGDTLDDETLRQYATMYRETRYFEEWYEEARARARIVIFEE